MILIDAPNLCYIAHYAMGELSNDDVPTGVTFGFLNYVLSIATKFEDNDLVFCFDSKKSWRKLILPSYKANRDEKEYTDEELWLFEHLHRQVMELRSDILPNLGFNNVFMSVGFEADDLIAHLVNQYAGKRDIVIVSSDEDLYQCLQPRVRIYKVKSKKVYTASAFKKEYDITPDKWADVKAIAGCSSDNLKGVFGVGEKTAIKFWKGELKPNSKAYQQIKISWSIYHSTLKLVKLPFDKPLRILKRKNKFNREAFIDTFDRLRFVYHLKEEQFAKWEKQFDL